MKSNSNLIEKWETSLKETFLGMFNALGGTYKGFSINEKKTTTATALVFWKFVRNIEAEQRREFLRNFLTHENRFIQLIAMIESLPDQVWRKILWTYNIDLPSASYLTEIDRELQVLYAYEAFLRRLTEEQYDRIFENYEDLIVKGKVPRVYLVGYRDRLKVWLKKITAKKLLESPYGEIERYGSKSAWAFNLFGLDFGFGKYPKGVLDDTEENDKNPRRFLSSKAHVNDFTVQQEEGGKYWAMYKSVRSNYVYFANRNIQLKSHICPGFWATLIMHLLFWIVSPLVFAHSFQNWEQSGYEMSLAKLLPLGVSFVVTPLWFICYVVGHVLDWLYTVLALMFPPAFKALIKFVIANKESFKKAARIIGRTIIIIAIIAVGALCLSVLYLLIVRAPEIWQVIVSALAWMNETLGIGYALVLLAVVSIITFIRAAIRDQEFTKWRLFLWFGTAGAVILILFDRFLTEPFLWALRTLGLWIGDQFSDYPFSASLTVFAISGLIGSFWFMLKSISNEDEFAKFSKRLRVGAIIYFAVIILLIFGMGMFENDSLSGDFVSDNKSVYIMPFFLCAFLSVLYMSTMKINPDTLDDRKFAKQISEGVFEDGVPYEEYKQYTRFQESQKYEIKKLAAFFAKQKTLLVQVKSDKKQIQKIVTLAKAISNNGWQIRSNVKYITLHVPQKVLTVFSVKMYRIVKFCDEEAGYETQLSKKYMKHILKSMVSGLTLAQAVSEVKVMNATTSAKAFAERKQKWVREKQKAKAKQLRKERWEKRMAAVGFVVSKVFQPFKWFFGGIFGFIWKGVKWVAKTIISLGIVIKLFYKMCPFVTRSEILK